MKRVAYRAGSFYESDGAACRRSAEALLEPEVTADLPDVVYGGMVPHAGWIFSGRTAAQVIKALWQRNRLERVVIFGADHWGVAGTGSVYNRGRWQTPIGAARIDERMASALLSAVKGLEAKPQAHEREHSIEVQLPLMQVLNKQVKVVPIGISPDPGNVEIGRAVGEVLAAKFPEASVLVSTDLTHYGPNYRFTPGGNGPAGLEWARENDRRILKLIETMRAEEIVEETSSRYNACGGGAVAAAIAATTAMGATQGICLDYTTSADVIRKLKGVWDENTVGYAGVVFA